MSTWNLHYIKLFIPFRVLIVLFILVVSLGQPISTQALGVAITVTTVADNTIKDGFCSLREAIINANQNWQVHTDCDTGFSDDGITFSDDLGNATIILSSSLPIINDPLGLVIDGGGDITISGNNLHQVFSVAPIGSLSLDNLTIKNGNSQITNIGGGVWNAGNLEIRNCFFINNRANNGGAIFNGLATLTISDSNFQENHASEGGGIYNEGGNVTIKNGFFYDNSAATGGAIKNVTTADHIGTIAITGTQLSQNESKYGAGIYNGESGWLEITDVDILKNKASNDGGGIYNLGSLKIVTSDISGNIADTAGGIYNERINPGDEENGLLDILRSTFHRNQADIAGGIYNSRGVLSVTSSTFKENYGEALFNFGGKVNVLKSDFVANSGHAIFNHGEDNWFTLAELWVTNSNISDNSITGVYNDFGKSNIFTTTFKGNQSSGVYNTNESVVSISKSTFLKNVSKRGGAVFNDNSYLHIHNSTLYGNFASDKGGGVYNTGKAYLLSTSFYGNWAAAYDGLYNSSSGQVELYNTILAKSGGAGVDCTNAPGGSVIGNNNLIQSQGQAACNFVNGVNGNIIGVDANYGILTGSPAYITLETNSPAIDSGDDVKCAAVSNESQNGVARPQGDHCDIGSYEAPFDSSSSSSQEEIRGLINLITNFVDTGNISAEHGKNLISILDASITALDASDSGTALKLLDEFFNQVKSLIDAGDIKSIYGQEIVDMVETIISHIK